MKNMRLLIIGLLLLGSGMVIGSAINHRPIPSVPPVVATPTGTPTLEQKQFEGPFLVTRVIDGDTIGLENGEKLRYIGIDTPETVDPRKPVQCFGKEASAKNKELVEGKRVWLQKDVTDRDKYHRLLRYVYLGDPGKIETVFVNLELVKQGFAHSYSYPPDISRQDEFVAAEKEAQEKHLGLWSSCSVKAQSEIAPSISPIVMLPSNEQNGSCVIKGNVGASGEKIYHLPGCGSYDKTAIDESRGEKWFCSESEAVAAGWRKAKNC